MPFTTREPSFNKGVAAAMSDEDTAQLGVEQAAITLTVNGESYHRTVDVRWSLGDFLRRSLQLTGTHFGCEHGVCGACTVLVDGEAVRSCLMLAIQADRSDVKTIEGVASRGGDLHPVQRAFHEHHGLQCGFCTPGMVLSTLELLGRRNDLSEQEIRTEMAGSVCRCTGYQFIVESVMAAQEAMEGSNGV